MDFLIEHKCPWYKRIFGKPIIRVEETDTSIGTFKEYVCLRCGKRYNITDYSTW